MIAFSNGIANKTQQEKKRSFPCCPHLLLPHLRFLPRRRQLLPLLVLPHERCGKRTSFLLNLFPCLSRACLGKMMTCHRDKNCTKEVQKLRKKRRLSAPAAALAFRLQAETKLAF